MICIKLKHGFTLLEVMVAMSILAMAVTTLLISRNNAIQQARHARELRRMQILLKQKMGEIAVGLEKRTGGACEEEGAENYLWNVDIRKIMLRSSPDSLGKVYAVPLRKITVTVRNKYEEEKFHKSLEAYYLMKDPADESEKKDNINKPRW